MDQLAWFVVGLTSGFLAGVGLMLRQTTRALNRVVNEFIEELGKENPDWDAFVRRGDEPPSLFPRRPPTPRAN